MSKIKAKNTLYNDPRYDVVVDSRMLEQHLKGKDQQIAELQKQLGELQGCLAKSEEERQMWQQMYKSADKINKNICETDIYPLQEENQKLKQQLEEKEKKQKRTNKVVKQFQKRVKYFRDKNEILEKQLEEKEKELKEIRVENYTIKSYRDFLNNQCKNLIKENKKLNRQLKSQPAEIVEKINGEIYTRMVVECKETKYTDINLILNTILKEYQK